MISPKLYADLHKRIDAWVQDHCKDEDWPAVFLGSDTIDHMTLTAFSVFQAVVESQKNAIDNGYLKCK